MSLKSRGIFNFSNFRNMFSEFRTRIGLLLLMGLGTKKSRLKKARDGRVLAISIACFSKFCLHQVSVPEGMYIAIVHREHQNKFMP